MGSFLPSPGGGGGGGFDPTGGGGIPTGGGGGSTISGPVGPVYSGGPIIKVIPPGGGPTTPAATVTPASFQSAVQGFLGSYLGYTFGPSLLRLLFFLLGLICIIGAIYLYKPEVITTPVKHATRAARTASTAAAA